MLQEAPRRMSSHKTSLVLGIAASIESMAEMKDGTLPDALARLRVIEADAKRIRQIIHPNPEPSR